MRRLLCLCLCIFVTFGATACGHEESVGSISLEYVIGCGVPEHFDTNGISYGMGKDIHERVTDFYVCESHLQGESAPFCILSIYMVRASIKRGADGSLYVEYQIKPDQECKLSLDAAGNITEVLNNVKKTERLKLSDVQLSISVSDKNGAELKNVDSHTNTNEHEYWYMCKYDGSVDPAKVTFKLECTIVPGDKAFKKEKAEMTFDQIYE